MPYEFKFPDVGEGIHEGELVKWLVTEGDSIKADQHIAEVETDKAIVQMPSPKKGKILKLHFKEGDVITVGQTFVTIEVEGEPSAAAPTPQITPQAPKPAAVEVPKDASGKYTGSVVGFVQEAKEVSPIFGSQGQESAAPSSSSHQVQATLAVKKLAQEKGVDLGGIRGSGPDGRIMESDVIAAAQKPAASKTMAGAAPTQSIADASTEKKSAHVRKYDFYGYLERQPLHGIRKKVAEHMMSSLHSSPQLTHFHMADVTALEKRREELKAQGKNVTALSFITRAVALTLKKHPLLNSMLENDEVVMKKYYNMGIAIDTEDGLVVPVVKRANTKTVEQIAEEIKKLATDARERKLNLMDLKGGSFSISNLGMFGVTHFTPILNYPEAALLGIGAVKDEVRVLGAEQNGQIRMSVRKMLPLSLTYDHRIASGADSARFMKDLCELLERPQDIENEAA